MTENIARSRCPASSTLSLPTSLTKLAYLLIEVPMMVAGDDVCIIDKSDPTVDVRGIDDHQITNIPIVTAGGVVNTQHGPAMAIPHQYAYIGQGKPFIRQDNLSGTGMTSMTSPLRLLVNCNTSLLVMGMLSPSLHFSMPIH